MNRIIDNILTNSLLIHRHVVGRKNSSLDQFGICRGTLDLLMLIHHNGQLNGKDLASMLGISTAAITQAVDRLVKDGLVERLENLEDRRITLLKLSKNGEEKMQKVTQNHCDILSVALKEGTPEELKILASFQEKILKALQTNKL